MKMFISLVSLISFFVIGFIASFYGLDLRKRSSWLYGGISFLCGIALIIALDGNLIDGLTVGAMLAFLTLAGGATMRRHKQRFGGK